MPRVYLSLGSNIGNKEEHMKKALKCIANEYKVSQVSSFYLTEPVGNKQQDWFLNCVAELYTTVDPKKLLISLKSIERKLGRTRTVKNGPRIIDIDILFYGEQIIHSKDLVVPHPLLQDRLFVLQPMMDINPGFLHPVLKKTMQELFMQRPWVEKVIPFK